VKRVSAYKTPSETDFGIDPCESGFKPNVFVDIIGQIELIKIDESELVELPFPRSEKRLRVLAQFLRSQAVFDAAEVFLLLRERT